MVAPLDFVFQDPRTLSAAQIAFYALGGAAGALLRDIAGGDGALVLPKIHDGKVYLGFLASVGMGMFFAVLADGNFATALLSGVGAPFLAERLLNTDKRVAKRKITKAEREADIIAHVEELESGGH